MTRSERRCTTYILKVAGLARRLHDSPALQEKFEKFVDAEMPHTSKKRIDRRVPTRWNSDHACLAAYISFEDPVGLLTNQNDLKLKAFSLSLNQWALATKLVAVLQVCLCILLSRMFLTDYQDL